MKMRNTLNTGGDFRNIGLAFVPVYDYEAFISHQNTEK